MSKKFNPLVSIIIPVYNGSNYMREAIDSAIAQTYKNIEIIVVNDGSTDNTEEIAKSYGDKIYYYSKENGGVATALNFAIKKSKGIHISWLSHDDLYYPDKIEKQVDKLLTIEKDDRLKTIIFSHADTLDVKNDKRQSTKSNFLDFNDDVSTYEFAMVDAFFASKIGGCTLLFPKKIFEKIGYFDESHLTVQDYSLFIKFYKAGIEYVYIDKVLVTSRHHEEQGTIVLYSKHLKELNDLYKRAFDDLKDFFQKMEFWQFNHFLEIMKSRCLDKVYAYMISEWSNDADNEKRPIIWMYWENKKGQRTPDYIRLCWKTIIFHNKSHYQIKILTEDNILQYLPDINKGYKSLDNIAHRADYFRFNLLRKYGGIWLDSDFVCIRTLADVELKLKESDFVVTSYKHQSGKTFPLIGFLAGRKGNDICSDVISIMEKNVSAVHKSKIQPSWDGFAGWELADILTRYNGKFYSYSTDYFCLYDVFVSRENALIEDSHDDVISVINNRNRFAFGHSIAHSSRSSNFKDMSEKSLLASNNFMGQLFRLSLGFAYVEERAEKVYHEQESTTVMISKSSPNKKSLKNSIRQMLYNVIWSISPSFRMQVGSKSRLNKLSSQANCLNKTVNEKIDNIDNKIDTSNFEVEEKIVHLTKSLDRLRNDYVINKNQVDFNANGDIMYLPGDHESKIVRYSCDTDKFIEEMKTFILKTDTVLDIGPGIRPQTFFTPKVHICIEPFKRYRDIVRPLFPNQSYFIFMKEGGIEGMKALDDNSVDSVFMLDLIEHLEKEKGMELLMEADRVARRQIIVFTPLGFYPMHFRGKGEKDEWGLDGIDVQEHKSGWLPEDFDETWDFHICTDCHEAFLPEEKKQGKRYSALMAIKTKKFIGFPISDKTPNFVKDVHRERIIESNTTEL